MSNQHSIDNATLSISENSRKIVEKIKANNLLSIGKAEKDANNKDIYLLAIALGLDKPIEKMVRTESWVRTIYFNQLDRSIVQAIYLANLPDTEDLSENCDIKDAFNYCKTLTEVGFREIDIFASEANYNPELMVEKLLEYADSIYDETVSSVQ